MDFKLILTFFGTLLLMGMALAGDHQDMSTLEKDRRLAVVKELSKAQKQITKALWKMYKETAPTGEHGGGSGEHNGPDGPDCSDESKESGEEEAYVQMKQQKIKETREKVESQVLKIAHSFLSMNKSFDKIKKKIDEEIKDNKSVINYTLYYHKRPHRGSSEEHSGEHGHKYPQGYRTSRQMQDAGEPVAKVVEVKEPEEVVRTVNGEEVMQTLPE